MHDKTSASGPPNKPARAANVSSELKLTIRNSGAALSGNAN
jgi:hypothetical protein